MKIRVIPRGYVKVEEERLDGRIDGCIGCLTPAEMFLALYKAFGKPQEGGEWSYMLRHNNVVLRIGSDGGRLCHDVWLSPGYMQEARRKQTKIMNVVARRLNENGIVFIPNGDMPDALYYTVRMKNTALMAKQRSLSVRELTKKMDAALTAEEKSVLYGGVSQFLPEVDAEIGSIVEAVTQ